MTDLTPEQIVDRLRTGDGFGNYTRDGLAAAALIEQQAEKLAKLESALASERADKKRLLDAAEIQGQELEARALAAEATIAQIAKLHHTKTGENDRGTYVICDYDKTDWPCKTHTILMQSDLSPLARHDAEVKATALEEAADMLNSVPAEKAYAESGGIDYAEELLRVRAAEIRKEATE